PEGVIKESQEMAAEVFGAKKSYFLINGSSCGLEALLLSVCNPGQKIIVPRNIHRSILSGIILSGAVPVFFMPEYDEGYGVFVHTLPQTIAQALEENPDARAVLLVSPTYNGVVSEVQKIADLVHQKGIPLLVDEAHGAHFGFHPDFPQSALKCGADAAVHGSHKMLSSFTQASMVHLQGDLIDQNRLESALRILQSTSTSYLLLASLEASLFQMHLQGKKLLEHTLQLSRFLKQSLNEMGYPIMNEKKYHLDPCKITVALESLPPTGPWAETWLRKNYQIQVELSAPNNLLLLLSPGNTWEDVKQLAAALSAMRTLEDSAWPEEALHHKKCALPSCLPEIVLPPRTVFFSAARIVKLEQAAGLICAETISCYPPGVPIICPGERFTAEVVEYLQSVKYMGVHFQGCQDPNLASVRVMV
ncbi:MAG: aminotransferase class I/II-fold pyridoxal phosphate-dependent enzyme, partial [Clostridia bacterium]|nr:aminotransferase class I/II-fold pyridoxal phosphate-dependent enzyme [Clostridia bacterium]